MICACPPFFLEGLARELAVSLGRGAACGTPAAGGLTIRRGGLRPRIERSRPSAGREAGRPKLPRDLVPSPTSPRRKRRAEFGSLFLAPAGCRFRRRLSSLPPRRERAVARPSTGINGARHLGRQTDRKREEWKGAFAIVPLDGRDLARRRETRHGTIRENGVPGMPRWSRSSTPLRTFGGGDTFRSEGNARLCRAEDPGATFKA